MQCKQGGMTGNIRANILTITRPCITIFLKFMYIICHNARYITYMYMKQMTWSNSETTGWPITLEKITSSKLDYPNLFIIYYIRIYYSLSHSRLL